MSKPKVPGGGQPPLTVEQERVVHETLRRLGTKWEDDRESDPDSREDGWENDSQWVAEQLELLEMHAVSVYGKRAWPINARWRGGVAKWLKRF
jgi:hypothetical protein